MSEGSDVGQNSRDFQLIIDQMDEPPTQQKQLAKFKKGLLPCIKQKMEIREYVNLQDMISQAKLVEAELHR